MKFSSPWSLLFLLSIPIVILMYILKQKFEERQVSSIYLWEQVLKDMEVNTPWQRLKKNLLLFLQISALSLLVAALSNPYIFINGWEGHNLIIVVDNTGSMNGKYEGTTRLDKAKERALNLLRSSNGKFTVVTSGVHPKIELNSGGKDEAVNKVKSIKPTNSSGDINEAASLVKVLQKQDNSAKAVIFTDSPFTLEGISGQVESFFSNMENVSLDFISHSRQEDGLRVLVRATNRSISGGSLKREISLYGDGKLIDVAQTEIEPGATKTIYFDKVPETTKYLSGEITEKDDLLQDNTIYEVISRYEKKKVLLFTDQNVFIERALSSIENLELYKTNDEKNITGKYDLYIFDGRLPKSMPQDGSLMFINPPDGSGIIKVNGDVDGGQGKVEKNVMTRYMEGTSFAVSKLRQLEIPYWADIILKAGDKSAVLAGDYKGRKVSIIGFDLHNSDFPLTPEFPIFMYNMTGYLLNMDFGEKKTVYCGDRIDISPLPDATEGYFKLPLGDNEKIKLKFPVTPFENTDAPGIYNLVQKTKDKEVQSMMSVNFPCETESTVNTAFKSVQNNVSAAGRMSLGTNIQLPLMLILLGAAVIEWVVYTRGY